MPDDGRYKTDVDMSKFEPQQDKKDPSHSVDVIMTQMNSYRDKIAKKLKENMDYKHTAEQNILGTTNPTRKNQSQNMAFKQECDMAWA